MKGGRTTHECRKALSLIERAHGTYHAGRRVRVLAEGLAELLPRDASVLDVGCGDGLLAYLVNQARPDLRIEGIDVLLRGKTHIPVREFDGVRLPFGDRSWDAVMATDVVHHADDPGALLTEMSRVANQNLVLKDHVIKGFLAEPTLVFMDRVGNARHGVALPYHYWSRSQWRDAITNMGWQEEVWNTDVGLFPWPLSWVFGRSLHFFARLSRKSSNWKR